MASDTPCLGVHVGPALFSASRTRQELHVVGYRLLGTPQGELLRVPGCCVRGGARTRSRSACRGDPVKINRAPLDLDVAMASGLPQPSWATLPTSVTQGATSSCDHMLL